MSETRTFKIAEVAKILRCTRQTVEALIAQGRLPCIKVTPKLYRISETALTDFIKVNH